jgi:hypothetical protein
MVTVRWFPRAIAVAIAVLSLVCPLRDVVACAGARACAAAPCCVAKAHGCPMHRADSGGRCRLRSCGEHDASISPAPPGLTALKPALPRPHTVSIPVMFACAAPIGAGVAPPDPPPPRRLG